MDLPIALTDAELDELPVNSIVAYLDSPVVDVYVRSGNPGDLYWLLTGTEVPFERIPTSIYEDEDLYLLWRPKEVGDRDE